MKSSDRGQALFLNRRPYRRRRLRDAAKLLPLVGAVLFFLPLFWLSAKGDGAGTSAVGIYLFVVWGFLIILAAILSRRVLFDPEGEEDTGA